MTYLLLLSNSIQNVAIGRMTFTDIVRIINHEDMDGLSLQCSIDETEWSDSLDVQLPVGLAVFEKEATKGGMQKKKENYLYQHCLKSLLGNPQNSISKV